MKRMNERQRRFVEEYLTDLNGAQAAVRVGYSPLRAASQASWMLSRPDVRAAVDAGVTARARRTGLVQDRILEELARMAFAQMRDLVRWGTNDGKPYVTVREDVDVAEAAHSTLGEIVLTGTSLRVKLTDKISALNSLARHLGMGAGKDVGDDGALTDAPVGPEAVKALAQIPEAVREKMRALLRGEG